MVKRLDRASYLIRFDDVCPTMDWAVWDRIEAILDRNEVRPILAVVPDNRDPKLIHSDPRAEFWTKVRDWRARGWAIALHGYQHVYSTSCSGMLRLNKKSEFAGLPESEQREKLQAGLRIFEENGVTAQCWIAPAHSFDRTTVRTLRDLGVTCISDGFWPWPYREKEGTVWLPQQMWELKPKPPGVWTACYHPYGWSEAEIERFGRAVEARREEFVDFSTATTLFVRDRLTLGDRFFAIRELYWSHRLKDWLSAARRAVRG